MKRLIFTYTILFILSIGLAAAQEESAFKPNKKNTFKNDGFKNDKGVESRGTKPPDPGGGGGNPIPISSGTILLGIGLSTYMIYKRKRKDAE